MIFKMNLNCEHLWVDGPDGNVRSKIPVNANSRTTTSTSNRISLLTNQSINHSNIDAHSGD